MYQLKNKGYSLIELIVVVCVIAILASAGAMSMSASRSMDTDKAASLMSLYMSKARTSSMTKTGTITFKFYIDDDKRYVSVERDVVGEPTTEDKKDLEFTDTINLYKRGAASAEALSFMEVKFSSSSGVVSALSCNGAVINDKKIDRIEFVSGDQTSNVYLVDSTGRSYSE